MLYRPTLILLLSITSPIVRAELS